MKVVFKKKVKYAGEYYNAGIEIEAKDQDLDMLKVAGAKVVEGNANNDKTESFLADMSIDELKAYANKKNIDIGQSTSKDGILKKIKAAGEI